jgi:hypothetical protein
MNAAYSRAWDRYLRAQYRLIRLLDPLIRPIWLTLGLSDTEELIVPGRVTGRARAVLVGLMLIDGRWYVGHPNGEAAQWVRNLAASGRATVRLRRKSATPVQAWLLPPGIERDRVIRATFVQHAFPGNVVYYLGRRHIAAVGAFFRLEPRPAGTDIAPPGDQDPARPA